eukprot:jgi/Chrpa1/9143/Chrysochromulina_OHIO_Genome00022521-RA
MPPSTPLSKWDPTGATTPQPYFPDTPSAGHSPRWALTKKRFSFGSKKWNTVESGNGTPVESSKDQEDREAAATRANASDVSLEAPMPNPKQPNPMDAPEERLPRGEGSPTNSPPMHEIAAKVHADADARAARAAVRSSTPQSAAAARARASPKVKRAEAEEGEAYELEVPPNAKPGSKLKFLIPGTAEAVVIVVPEGAEPGRIISFSMPGNKDEVVRAELLDEEETEEETYELEVPPNAKPGSKLKFLIPGTAETVVIMMPEGAEPGRIISFSMPRNKDEVVQAQLLEQTQAATVIQTRVRGKHARRAARTKIEARSIELAAASPEKEKDVPKSEALAHAVEAEVALKTAPSTMPASSARAAAEAKKAELGAAATRAADWAAAAKAVADKAAATTSPVARPTTPVARPTTPVEIHQERLAEIAAKKARDRTAEDEREAKHAFLLESELETKLAADLDELTNREQAAQHALAETEATEAAVASALGKVRLSKAEIALFDEKALSLQQVSALFAAYQKQCNSCYGALEAAEDNAKVLLAVQNSTKARLAEELAESEAKLAKQSTKTRMKKTELEALADMCTVAEERPSEVLLHATCEAATQEMKLQMATLATQLRVDEHARQQESVSEMARVLSGQQKRAEATQLIVQLINSKLDKDAEHIGRLHEQIEALELAETHAALHATLVNAGFATDVLAATELKAVQERALTRAAPPKLGTPGVAPEETNLNAAFQLAPEAEGGQPTREALLAEMGLVVGAQCGATARCLRDLEQWQAQFQADAEVASAQRKNQLIAASAEKTALEVSKAEREAYVAKKEAQLKVERAEASATAKVIHVMHGCIRMLEEEIAACNAYQSKCQSASDAAKAEKASAVGVLEGLQLKHKGYQRQGHAVLESEVKVQEQYTKYARGLSAQLEVLRVEIASHPLSSEFEWKGEGTAPSKTGAQLLAQHKVESTRWLAELQARRGLVASKLDELRSRLSDAEKHAAQESKSLAELRAQQVTVLYDLEQYAEQLEAKSPRAAAITSPRRSPRRAIVATMAFPSAKKPSSVGSIFVGRAQIAPSDSELLEATPKPVEQHVSPYSAQERFLRAKEQKILAEEENPDYNPDLAPTPPPGTPARELSFPKYTSPRGDAPTPPANKAPSPPPRGVGSPASVATATGRKLDSPMKSPRGNLGTS